VFVSLGGHITAYIRRQSHLLYAIDPPKLSISHSVIIIMGMWVSAARGLTLFRIVLVRHQAATTINEALPSAVSQVMREELSKTVVGEFFIGRGWICVPWVI